MSQDKSDLVYESKIILSDIVILLVLVHTIFPLCELLKIDHGRYSKARNNDGEVLLLSVSEIGRTRPLDSYEHH